MLDLTERQTQVLDFINQHATQVGSPPTHDEIATHFHWKSSFSVRQHLRLLQRKGALQCTPGKARCIKTLREPVKGSIPVLGSIPAGPLAEAIQTAEDLLPPMEKVFRGAQLYALRVRGDSMKCAGILNGDLAVLNYQPDVSQGEIAAVLFKNESTLKRVLRTATGVTLRADNPAYEDICITGSAAEDVRIAGRLIGIIRQNI